MSMQSEKIRREDRILEVVTDVGYWLMAAGFTVAAALIMVRTLVTAA